MRNCQKKNWRINLQPHLLRFQKDQKYLFIDTETECLNLCHNKPWEVSFITTKYDEVESENQIFVWYDDLVVGQGAAVVTGFSTDNYESFKRRGTQKYSIRGKVVDTVKPEQAVKTLISYLYDPSYIIVWHNGQRFDSFTLNNLFKIAQKELDYSFISRTIDTVALARAIEKGVNDYNFKEEPSLNFKWANFYEKKMKVNQKALLEKYEISHDVNKLHEGIYDLQCLKKIFFKQIWGINI